MELVTQFYLESTNGLLGGQLYCYEGILPVNVGDEVFGDFPKQWCTEDILDAVVVSKCFHSYEDVLHLVVNCRRR